MEYSSVNADFAAPSKRRKNGTVEPVRELGAAVFVFNLLVILQLQIVAIMTHTKLRFIEA
jgi:hypothetical protein